VEEGSFLEPEDFARKGEKQKPPLETERTTKGFVTSCCIGTRGKGERYKKKCCAQGGIIATLVNKFLNQGLCPKVPVGGVAEK